jgi:hypothetical protein
LFGEIAAETNKYIRERKKEAVQHEPRVSKTSNFVSPGVP